MATFQQSLLWAVFLLSWNAWCVLCVHQHCWPCLWPVCNWAALGWLPKCWVHGRAGSCFVVHLCHVLSKLLSKQFIAPCPCFLFRPGFCLDSCPLNSQYRWKSFAKAFVSEGRCLLWQKPGGTVPCKPYSWCPSRPSSSSQSVAGTVSQHALWSQTCDSHCLALLIALSFLVPALKSVVPFSLTLSAWHSLFPLAVSFLVSSYFCWDIATLEKCDWKQ